MCLEAARDDTDERGQLWFGRLLGGLQRGTISHIQDIINMFSEHNFLHKKNKISMMQIVKLIGLNHRIHSISMHSLLDYFLIIFIYFIVFDSLRS